MWDKKVFAILTPYDERGLARKAFRLQQNATWYSGGAPKGIVEEPTIDSREPTPAPESSSKCIDSAVFLLLTLNDKPKNPLRGWQVGTDLLSSDVLLGYRGSSGISGRHFRITIAEDLSVWLLDESTYGTAVGYDGMAKHETQSKNEWILSYMPNRRNEWKEVVVYVPGANGLAFKIEFPNHEAGGQGYLAHLQAFWKESNTALPPVNIMGLDSNPTTAVPSQPRTPYQKPIYIDGGFLGQGQFGEVRKFINTRNGHCYAGKKFHPQDQVLKAREKRKRDEERRLQRFRNEFEIMDKNPHVSLTLSVCRGGLTIQQPNIMQVIDFLETPVPVLLMPYYSLGNLQDLENVSEKQCVSAFSQILLGLDHLHRRGIAHRDLKPANILVDCEEPFTIVITDFGLSKHVPESLLKTFCGSHLYNAPEIYPGNNKGYGPSVDIWSAGVIILELIYGLPSQPNMEGFEGEEWNKRWYSCWAKALVAKVNDLNENNDKVIDILVHMVNIEPQKRATADHCLLRGCDNRIFRQRYTGDRVDADTLDVNSTTVILGGNLWDKSGSYQMEPADPPTTSSHSISGSSSERPTRRQKKITENVKSWSLTIGPSNSDSDGGFDIEHSQGKRDEVTGIFIRKDHFTRSLQNGSACVDDAREGGTRKQTGLTGLIGEEQRNITGMASFEKRVYEMLA
ncbi:MAG: hypothetical protein Q9164_001664 [Protoblastenia rupestris]